MKNTEREKQKTCKPSRMEFSKKLMIFASVMFSLTWAVAVYSWFMYSEIPLDLLQYASWLYGATFVSYCGKTAYENKEKIKGGGLDE